MKMKSRVAGLVILALIVYVICCNTEVLCAESRFVDNGDGTITDTQTGLMWLKDAKCLEQKNWEDALDKVSDFNSNPDNYRWCSDYTANYSDRALPNIRELESLINKEVTNPYTWLNGQGFSDVQRYYWTSTTFSGDNIKAWRVEMSAGFGEASGKAAIHNVIVVRSVQPSSSLIYKTGQKNSWKSGDDGALQRGIGWKTPRFTDNGDGTVTDTLTGLMWLKDTKCLGEADWQKFFDVMSDFNLQPQLYKCADYSNSYSDWRVPVLNELQSLIDYSLSSPAIPQDNFPFANVKYPWNYWTSVSYAGNMEYAWTISLKDGGTGWYGKKYEDSIWLVRSEQHISPSPVWDADGDNRWSLQDIIYGLQILCGMRSGK